MKNSSPTLLLMIVSSLVILLFAAKKSEDKRILIQEQHEKEIRCLVRENQQLTKELNRQKYLALLIYNHADSKSMKKDTTLTKLMLTGDNQ